MNKKDVNGNTPLATACGTGGAKSVDVLLKFGADLNSVSINNDTPAHECFYRGNIDCLEKLI